MVSVDFIVPMFSRRTSWRLMETLCPLCSISALKCHVGIDWGWPVLFPVPSFLSLKLGGSRRVNWSYSLGVSKAVILRCLHGRINPTFPRVSNWLSWWPAFPKESSWLLFVTVPTCSPANRGSILFLYSLFDGFAGSFSAPPFPWAFLLLPSTYFHLVTDFLPHLRLSQDCASIFLDLFLLPQRHYFPFFESGQLM